MKNTPLIVLFIGLLSTSCKQNAEDSKNEKTSKIEKANKNEKAIVKVSPILNIDSTSIENKQLFETYLDYPLYQEGEYKKGSTVSVPVGQSKTTFVGSSIPKTNSPKFDYLGTSITQGFHVVSAHYLKHSETYLIDRTHGYIDTIWGDNPSFHAGDTYLAAKSMDYSLSKAPNGFQIWRLFDGEKRWSKILEFDQQDWVPLECKWSNSEPAFLIVKRTSIENYNREKPDIKTNIEYVKYSFK